MKQSTDSDSDSGELFHRRSPNWYQKDITNNDSFPGPYKNDVFNAKSKKPERNFLKQSVFKRLVEKVEKPIFQNFPRKKMMDSRFETIPVPKDPRLRKSSVYYSKNRDLMLEDCPVPSSSSNISVLNFPAVNYNDPRLNRNKNGPSKMQNLQDSEIYSRFRPNLNDMVERKKYEKSKKANRDVEEIIPPTNSIKLDSKKNKNIKLGTRKEQNKMHYYPKYHRPSNRNDYFTNKSLNPKKSLVAASSSSTSNFKIPKKKKEVNVESTNIIEHDNPTTDKNMDNNSMYFQNDKSFVRSKHRNRISSNNFKKNNKNRDYHSRLHSNNSNLKQIHLSKEHRQDELRSADKIIVKSNAVIDIALSDSDSMSTVSTDSSILVKTEDNYDLEKFSSEQSVSSDDSTVIQANPVLEEPNIDTQMNLTNKSNEIKNPEFSSKEELLQMLSTKFPNKFNEIKQIIERSDSADQTPDKVMSSEDSIEKVDTADKQEKFAADNEVASEDDDDNNDDVDEDDNYSDDNGEDVDTTSTSTIVSKKKPRQTSLQAQKALTKQLDSKYKSCSKSSNAKDQKKSELVLPFDIDVKVLIEKINIKEKKLAPSNVSKLDSEETEVKTTKPKKKSKSQWSTGVIQKKKKKSIITTVPEPPKNNNPDIIRTVPEPPKNNNPDIYIAGRMNYRCLYCNFKGNWLINHYVIKHPKLEVCLSRLTPETAEEIKENQMSRIGTKVYNKKSINIMFNCFFCNKNKTFNKRYWREHYTTHTGEYNYKCSACDYRNSYIQQTTNHTKKCNGVAIKIRNTKFEDNHFYGYLCSVCNYVQISKKKLETHIKTQHTDKAEIIKFSLLNYDNKQKMKPRKKPENDDFSDIINLPVPEREKLISIADKLNKGFNIVDQLVSDKNLSNLYERDISHESESDIPLIELKTGLTSKNSSLTKDLEISYLSSQKINIGSSLVSVLKKGQQINILKQTSNYGIKISNVESLNNTILTTDANKQKLINAERSPSESLTNALKPWSNTECSKIVPMIVKMLTEISLLSAFKCMGRSCSYTTSDSNKFDEHLNNHEEFIAHQHVPDLDTMSWLECSYCDLFADNCLTLRKHVVDEHITCIFQCNYCFYRSCTAFNVVVHHELYHKLKILKILVCNGKMKYLGNEELDHLLKSRDKNVRPLACINNECNKKFFIPKTFVDHLADHSGTYFICEFCELKIRKESATRHMLCHGIGIFNCIHCVFGINNLKSMQHHMTNQHPSELLFICVRVLPRDLNDVSSINYSDINSILVAQISDNSKIDNSTLRFCYLTDNELSYRLPGLYTENFPNILIQENIRNDNRNTLLLRQAFSNLDSIEDIKKYKNFIINYLEFKKYYQERIEAQIVAKTPTSASADELPNLACSSQDIGRSKTFPDAPKYVAEQQRFVCGAIGCKYETINSDMLRSHRNTLHSDEQNYKCPSSPVRWDNARVTSIRRILFQDENSLTSDGDDKKDDDDDEYNPLSLLQPIKGVLSLNNDCSGINSDSSNKLEGNITFVCLYCIKNCRRLYQLKFHWEISHKMSKTIAGKSYPGRAFLFKIIKIYRCMYCKKSLSYTDIVNHIQRVHPKKRFVTVNPNNLKQCGQCNYQIDNTTKFYDHYQNEHVLTKHDSMDFLTNDFLTELLKLNNGTKYYCELCSYFGDTIDEIKEHSTDSHKEFTANYKQKDNEILYCCPHCKSSNSDDFKIIKHIIKSHGTLYKCNYCDSLFKHTKLITEHNLDVHNKKDKSYSTIGLDSIPKRCEMMKIVFSNGFVIKKIDARQTKYGSFDDITIKLMELEELNYSDLEPNIDKGKISNSSLEDDGAPKKRQRLIESVDNIKSDQGMEEFEIKPFSNYGKRFKPLNLKDIYTNMNFGENYVQIP